MSSLLHRWPHRKTSPPSKPKRPRRGSSGEGILDDAGWPDERIGLASPAVIEMMPLERRPRPFYPSREDSAWASGFSLGLEGIEAEPESHWPGTVRAHFVDGYNWGLFERDELEGADGDRAEVLREEAMQKWLDERPSGECHDSPEWNDWLRAQPK